MTATLHLDPPIGPVGTVVVVRAIGFSGGASLQVSLLGEAGAVLRESGTTDSTGAAKVSFAVPHDSHLGPGWHCVVANATVDASPEVAMAIFEVTASPVAPVPAAPPGPTPITVVEPIIEEGGKSGGAAGIVGSDRVESEADRSEAAAQRAPEPPTSMGSGDQPLEATTVLAAPEAAGTAGASSDVGTGKTRPRHRRNRRSEVATVRAPKRPPRRKRTDRPGATPEPPPPTPGVQVDRPAPKSPPSPADQIRPPAPERRPPPRTARVPREAQKPPARSSAAFGRTPEQPPGSSATRFRPAPEPPSRTRAVRARPPAPSPARLDRTDQSSRRPGTTDTAAPAVRPRAGVGVLLAIAVLGGGLLAASGLPAPPPGQTASDVVAASLDLPGGRQGSGAAPISAATTASATRASQLGSGQAVTLAFGGDVHFEGPVAKRLSANSHTVFNPAKPLYAGADLTMVNLETAITNGGVAAPKQFVFRAPPTALNAIKAGGITLVTEANNHGEDYGAQGLDDSIAAATHAGLPVIGIGENVAQAFAPYRATIKGQRIAIIAATHVLDDNLRDQWTATDTHPGLASAYDLDHLLTAVRQARLTSDTLAVFLHWGVETQSCPTPGQEELAHQAVAAGADIVVGSHAHVLLGGGLMDGAMVSYGLGNFAFYATQPAQLESGVLRVTVTGRRIDAYRWVPARLSGGVATPLSGSSARSALSRWSALRSCTDLDA